MYYYVSKVTIHKYLAYEKRCSILACLWFSAMLATSIPYFYRENWTFLTIHFTNILKVVDVLLLAAIFLMDRQDYEIMKKETLLIASCDLRELKKQYGTIRHHAKVLIIAGGISCCGGTISLPLIYYCVTDMEYAGQLGILCTAAIALGVYCVLYALLISQAYVNILKKSNV